jgi:hypothetical protein
MSLLQSTIHPELTAIHNGVDGPEKVVCQPARLRNSQSHASLLSPLTPLIRLVRDPATSIEGLLGRVWIGDDGKEEQKKAEVDRRRQLLYGRMKDVRAMQHMPRLNANCCADDEL